MVARWPKAKLEKPTRAGWDVEWYAPEQKWYFQKTGDEDVYVYAQWDARNQKWYCRSGDENIWAE